MGVSGRRRTLMAIETTGTGHGQGPCGARTRSGGTCGKTAGWGTEHVGIGRCKLHGGCTPTQVKTARAEQARQAVAAFGLPLDVEPHEALREELHRAADLGFVRQRACPR